MNSKSKHKGVVMFYSIIYSGRRRNFRVLISFILIVLNMNMFSGCTTTNIEYINPDVQVSDILKDISGIKLVNGKTIECRNNLIKIDKSSYSTGSVYIQTLDTIKAGSSGYSYRTSWNELSIPLSDIRNFQIEETKVNAAMGAGIVLGAMVIVSLLILAVSDPIFGK